MRNPDEKLVYDLIDALTNKISALEEENRLLKIERDSAIRSQKESFEEMDKQIQELKKENEKLKEHNQVLKHAYDSIKGNKSVF